MRNRRDRKEEEMMYYHWLYNVDGIGRKTMQRILKAAEPVELYEKGTENLKGIMNDSIIYQIESSRKRWHAQREWENLKKNKIFMMYRKHETYPKKLLAIPDPPEVLYGIGNQELLSTPCAAIIGARNCSSYGRFVAKELAKEMAKYKITVVSGMARGIDGICQWEALEHGGSSIGVLGSGVKICYPRENQHLYQGLMEKGLILSECTPYTGPKAGLFPERNRIISGLSDIVVVIEAGERSGTLITVDMALEQGKEVYCIPGRITDQMSKGCNQLIKTGAGIVVSMEDFIEEVCGRFSRTYKHNRKIVKDTITMQEKNLLSCLDIMPKSMEEIWQEAKAKKIVNSLPECMELLMRLCVNGKIVQEEGNYRLSGK